MNLFEIIVLTLVFVPVFAWTRAVLGMAGPFAGGPRSLMAFCVAGLSVAGLARGLLPFEEAHGPNPTVRSNPLVDFVLLPYAALGLTLLIGILLLFLSAIRRRLSGSIRRRDAHRKRMDEEWEPNRRD